MHFTLEPLTNPLALLHWTILRNVFFLAFMYMNIHPSNQYLSFLVLSGAYLQHEATAENKL